jgi:hypothetical protein
MLHMTSKIPTVAIFVIADLEIKFNIEFISMCDLAPNQISHNNQFFEHYSSSKIFIYNNVSEIGITSSDWAQLPRLFYLRTVRESSRRNIVLNTN